MKEAVCTLLLVASTPGWAGLMEWIPCEKECKTASIQIPDFEGPKRVTAHWVRPGVVRLEWEKLSHLDPQDRIRVETRTFGGDWVDLKQLPGNTIQLEVPGFTTPLGIDRGKASEVHFRISRFREVASNRVLYRATEAALVLPGEAVRLDVFFASGQAILTFKDEAGNPVVHFERKIWFQVNAQKKRGLTVSTGEIGVHSLSLPAHSKSGLLKIWWKPNQVKPDEYSMGSTP